MVGRTSRPGGRAGLPIVPATHMPTPADDPASIFDRSNGGGRQGLADRSIRRCSPRLGVPSNAMEPAHQAGLRTFSSVAEDILARAPRRGGTRIVAVDGGSAAGKSTFATRLARALGTSVLHTDDVAWWESFFGWTSLLVEGVLEPLLEGRSVRFRPPAWEAREREGAIVAEPGPSVVVEGVGAGRQELSGYLDHLIWVDTDRQLAYERGLARPGEDPGFWREWEIAEEEHFSRDRPWVRADLLVSNDPPLPPDPERQLRVIDAATWRIEDRPR